MSLSPSLPAARLSRPEIDTLGWLALAGSLAAIAWSPLFARFSEIGPLATGFWRMAFACPLLFAWARASAGRGVGPGAGWRRGWGVAALAGLAFAADLGFFHVALETTSVANVSFLGNLSSVFAILGGALLFRERVPGRVWGALGVSLVGAWVLGGAVTSVEGVRAGDLLAIAAAGAYAVYMLAIKAAGPVLSSGAVMARSSLVCAGLLLVAALAAGEAILPATPAGWLPLVALGVVTHSLGQGLTAVALRRLAMAPLALAVLVQPVLTTVLAAVVLGEGLSPLQGVGCGLVLAGVLSVRLR